MNRAWQSSMGKKVVVYDMVKRPSTLSVVPSQFGSLDGHCERNYTVGVNSQDYQRRLSSELNAIRNIRNFDIAKDVDLNDWPAAFQNLYLSTAMTSANHNASDKRKDSSRTGYECWDVLPLWSVP